MLYFSKNPLILASGCNWPGASPSLTRVRGYELGEPGKRLQKVFHIVLGDITRGVSGPLPLNHEDIPSEINPEPY